MKYQPEQENHPDGDDASGKVSPWAPFGRAAFAVVWTATVIANVGA